jgi:hypothetical protein
LREVLNLPEGVGPADHAAELVGQLRGDHRLAAVRQPAVLHDRLQVGRERGDEAGGEDAAPVHVDPELAEDAGQDRRERGRVARLRLGVALLPDGRGRVDRAERPGRAAAPGGIRQRVAPRRAETRSTCTHGATSSWACAARLRGRRPGALPGGDGRGRRPAEADRAGGDLVAVVPGRAGRAGRRIVAPTSGRGAVEETAALAADRESVRRPAGLLAPAPGGWSGHTLDAGGGVAAGPVGRVASGDWSGGAPGAPGMGDWPGEITGTTAAGLLYRRMIAWTRGCTAAETGVVHPCWM